MAMAAPVNVKSRLTTLVSVEAEPRLMHAPTQARFTWPLSKR